MLTGSNGPAEVVRSLLALMEGKSYRFGFVDPCSTYRVILWKESKGELILDQEIRGKINLFRMEVTQAILV